MRRGIFFKANSRQEKILYPVGRLNVTYNRLKKNKSENVIISIMEKTYYVYIMASISNVLYTGVTSRLEQRVWQHKNGQGSDFTKKYHVNRLVWYGDTDDPNISIEWEKRIKGWSRAKKIKLIEEENQNWDDLAENWF